MRRIQKRWLVLVLALCLLPGMAACGEPAAAFTAEEARTIVEALFAAAAGTTTEAEKELRASLTEEQCLERSAELATYREMTLPWLCRAFTPEMDEAADIDVPAPEETPIVEEIWTLEDGYAALNESAMGRAYLELLRSLGFDGAEDCMQGTAQACRVWLAEIDGTALEEINSDYTCWLYCPDTQIDYPVVQGDDNSWYLHRLFNGEYNACGTLFIDYRNLPDFQDPNTLIYGHHMRNGSMFKAITFYEDQAWYEAHPYMLMISNHEIAVLEMFAGYTTSKRDHCYDIAISDENDLRDFVDEAKQKSDFSCGVEPLAGDRLVTLSTCAYAFQNARYIAIGRLNTIWLADEATYM